MYSDVHGSEIHVFGLRDQDWVVHAVQPPPASEGGDSRPGAAGLESELARQLRVVRGERDDALQVHHPTHTEALCVSVLNLYVLVPSQRLSEATTPLKGGDGGVVGQAVATVAKLRERAEKAEAALGAAK